MHTPASLKDALATQPEKDWVRLVAWWLNYAEELDEDPGKTDNSTLDAVVASAAAYAAQRRGLDVPAWTAERRAPRFWYQGPSGLFGWSLAHAPQTFLNRGVIVEADSLETV